MRERGQASVETVALIAAVLALAAALLFGIARFSAPLAAALGRALSGVVAPGTPAAPGLDGLESAILAARGCSAPKACTEPGHHPPPRPRLTFPCAAHRNGG